MKPNYIKDNPKIYLVAPSFGTTTTPYKERMDKALINIKKITNNVIIGPNVFKLEYPCASETAKTRAKEIIDALKSDADVIWSVGGGEIMCQILEYIDFNELKNIKPKWYIGYSDNTNMILPLATYLNMEAIYGPHAPDLYRYPFDYEIKDTLRMLKGEKIFKGYKSFQLSRNDEIFPKYHLDKRNKISTYNYNKPFEGKLLGGCLDCLVTICGTKFDNVAEFTKNSKEKIIFFLEACEMNPMDIMRGLFQLKNANWFNNVSGFILGRSMFYGMEQFGMYDKDSYIESLKYLNVPMIFNCDFGHIGPTIPIRSNAYAKISVENNLLKIEYKE